MKATTLALLLAFGLALPGARADDAADAATRQQITDLQRRAEQALAGASGTALYRPA